MDSREVIIPERTSSKRKAQRSVSDDDHESLLKRRDDLNASVSKDRKKLRPQQSFDKIYWDERLKITKSNADSLNLTYRIEEQVYTNTATPWTESEKAISLREQIQSSKLDQKLCQAQATRLVDKGLAACTRRAFVKLFTASKNGLGITTGAGRRATRDQSSFRSSLIKASNARNPNPESDSLWCPITGLWHDPESLTAAHIFAYHHGQDSMTAIFGEDVLGELFSPRNGIMMSTVAERRFDKGLFVIVPDVEENPSESTISRWCSSSVRDYKIKVLDKSHPLMIQFINGNTLDKKWSDIDGQRVSFRGDFRPRARYLYFHYCSSVLRRAWAPSLTWETTKNELGKKVWATRGRYLAKAQILAFVEEIGHEVEDALLRGARDPDADVDEVDETALAAANDQIRLPREDEEKQEIMGIAEPKAMMSVTLEETDSEDDEEEDQ